MAKKVTAWRILVDGNPITRWVTSRTEAVNQYAALQDKNVDKVVTIQKGAGVDYGRLGGGLTVPDGAEIGEVPLSEVGVDRSVIKQKLGGDQPKKPISSLRKPRRDSRPETDTPKKTVSRAPKKAKTESELLRERVAKRQPGGQSLGRVERLERGAGASLGRQRGLVLAGQGASYDPAPGLANIDNKIYRDLTKQNVQWRTSGKIFNVSFNGRFRGNAMVHLIEVDRNGGIRINLDAISVDDRIRKLFMRHLADEAIRSIRGMKSQVKGMGNYPYGIKRRISPDGVAWVPLKESTLYFRHLKAGGAASFQDRPGLATAGEFVKDGRFFDPATGDARSIPTARGQAFAMRETSKHIYNGLGLIEAGNEYAYVGWKGYHEDYGIPISTIALKQHRGFAQTFTAARIQGMTFGEDVSTVVPARPFIGLQPHFFKVTERMAELLGRHWLLDNEGKKTTIRRGSAAFQMHAVLAKMGR